MGIEEGLTSRNRILLTVAQSVPCLDSNPETSSKLSYREQQSDLRRRLGRVYELKNGNLLDTLERGVLYPVLSIDWSPAADAAARCEKAKEDDFGSDLYVLQGLYEEVRRIEPVSGRVENNQPRSYIILGFKSLESSISSVLETTWRDWTGARSIYLNLHSEFDLVKIVFYHRVVPRSQLDLFMYVVLVELANVRADNLIRLLDFVQRTRVERMNGYISLYRDLGILDSDSNYFSGEERGESRLSNIHNSKMSGSRDSLLASSSDNDSRNCSRKVSSNSDSSDRQSSSSSHWRNPQPAQPLDQTNARSYWRTTSLTNPHWSDESEITNSDWRRESSLLATESAERLSLPAPLAATPCSSLLRTESPPEGFTSQVSQLREALQLSSLPTLPRRRRHLVPLTATVLPSSVSIHSTVPYVSLDGGPTVKHRPSIAGTIRSSLIIKTKQ